MYRLSIVRAARHCGAGESLLAVSERLKSCATFPKGKDGVPIQAIGEPTVLLQRESVADATDPYSSLEAIIAAEVRRPFDLQAGRCFGRLW